MQLSGIHLTDQGSPVGSGKIGLFRNNTPIPVRPHQSVTLLSYRNEHRDMICLHESYQERDQSSGFYSGLPDTRDAHFTFFLPMALTRFIKGQFQNLRPGLQDNIAFESTQSDKLRSTEMGSLYIKLPDMTNTDDFVHLVIKRMATSSTHSNDGITIDILAEMQAIGLGGWASNVRDHDYDKNADYRLDISFNINRETLEFRYEDGVKQGASTSGMTRYYPGDEVQTDLANMNIKHPLIYNTGGIYALSSEGVHAFNFSGPTRIQPVKLRGWGWGSVYDADTQWGRNDLVLPFLTKSFLEEHLDAMSTFEHDVLRTSINLNQGNMGYHVENETTDYMSKNSDALNVRDIEALDITIEVDRFGLVMVLDGKLSRVQPNTRSESDKPAQGPRYSKSLMIPWEVLICKDFHLPKFMRHWYGQRLAKTEELAKRINQQQSFKNANDKKAEMIQSGILPALDFNLDTSNRIEFSSDENFLQSASRRLKGIFTEQEPTLPFPVKRRAG